MAQRASSDKRSPQQSPPFRPTFIDLFCGIGGIRLGFEAAGATCVFSCDWDKFARATYEANFDEVPAGDIHDESIVIPAHNILAAGFPCQPFSISGVSKKNSLGRAHGFADKTQGTLFFEIAKILEERNPEAFLLENVKNLVSHNRGDTFRTILKVLTEERKYQVHYRVLDAEPYVSQHRERIFIVGFKTPRTFQWPTPPSPDERVPLTKILDSKVDEKYILSAHLWRYLQDYAKKHRAAGNGFGYGLVSRTKHDVTRTLSARYYKDGSEILVSRGPRSRPRRLTPRECARLMGFDDKFQIPVSDTQAYKQFGNSVVVPLVAAVANQVVQALREPPGTMSDRELAGERDPVLA